MSDELEFRVDDRGVRDALALAIARSDPEMAKAILKTGQIVSEEAKRRAPKAHPHRSKGKTLADSIFAKVLSRSAVVRSNKRYASIQEFGGHTGAHEIKPRKKKALAFGGGVYRKVSHPGGTIRARHYMWGALDAKTHEVEDEISKAVDAALKGFSE